MMKGKDDDDNEPPNWTVCPITMDVMTDPVTVDSICQHTFSRVALQEWLKKRRNKTCPLCSTPIRSRTICPSSMLREAIEERMLLPPGGDAVKSTKPTSVSVEDDDTTTREGDDVIEDPPPRRHRRRLSNSNAADDDDDDGAIGLFTLTCLDRANRYFCRIICCLIPLFLVCSAFMLIMERVRRNSWQDQVRASDSEDCNDYHCMYPFNDEGLIFPVPLPYDTLVPTVLETSAPALSLSDDDSSDYFLPSSTIETILENPGCPQSMALTWVLQHPDFGVMETWRKQQLMALSTYYYSTVVGHPPDNDDDDDHDGWLDATVHECNWWGSEEEIHPSWTRAMPDCTEEGKYQVFEQEGFVHTTTTTVLPAEISLLTDLKELWLPGINLGGPLPSEIGLLTSLKELWLPHNELTGSIPFELADMKALEHVHLGGNQMSGIVPFEVCDFEELRMITVDCEAVDCFCYQCRCW